MDFARFEELLEESVTRHILQLLQRVDLRQLVLHAPLVQGIDYCCEAGIVKSLLAEAGKAMLM